MGPQRGPGQGLEVRRGQPGPADPPGRPAGEGLPGGAGRARVLERVCCGRALRASAPGDLCFRGAAWRLRGAGLRRPGGGAG